MTFEDYVKNYSEHHRVWWGGGVPWRVYKGILRPLSLPHSEPKLDGNEIKRLLRASRTAFAMWTYDFDSGPSEWWWTIAKAPYAIETLPRKARYDIRKGLKHCRVEMISGKTLAEVGYECYRGAMQRHHQSKPLGRTEFVNAMPDADRDGSHQIWGVFVEGTLAGFGVYLVLDRVIHLVDAMFDPAYFGSHASYALIHTVTEHYLNKEDGLYLTSGWRSVSHETQFEEFLVRNFGYRKAYCKLGLEYAPAVRILARLIHAAGPVWTRIPLPAMLANKLSVVNKLVSIQRTMPTVI